MNQGAASDREAVMACLDEIDTVLDKLAALSVDALLPAEILTVLARREIQTRKQPSIDHRLLNRLVSDGTHPFRRPDITHLITHQKRPLPPRHQLNPRWQVLPRRWRPLRSHA